MARKPKQTDQSAISPLNDGHCDILNQVLGQSAETAKLIELCEESGLDMRRIKAENAEHAKLAGDIKRNFFPNKP